MATSSKNLLTVFGALANPHRMRIVAALHKNGRTYVSQLAREMGISRPLLILHLKKLEEAALVTSKFELSSDGKALNYYELAAFDIALNPTSITKAAATLPAAETDLSKD